MREIAQGMSKEMLGTLLTTFLIVVVVLFYNGLHETAPEIYDNMFFTENDLINFIYFAGIGGGVAFTIWIVYKLFNLLTENRGL